MDVSPLYPKKGECVSEANGTIPKPFPILTALTSTAHSGGLPFCEDSI
uniref:Uncharacterized protein LOC105140079 n=1 Tax=Rhizophora mucronata TaxID=61149 RepID=A0A2P2J4Q7_RHIMU